MTIVAKKTNPAEVDTPLTNKVALYVDCCDGVTKIKDSEGCIQNISCGVSVCDIPTDNCQLCNGCNYLKGIGAAGTAPSGSGWQAPANGFLLLRMTGGQHYSNQYNALTFYGGGISATIPSQKSSDTAAISTFPVIAGCTYTWSGGSESGYQHSSSVSVVGFIPFC